MRIVFASDHAGYDLKRKLLLIASKKHDVVDVGSYGKNIHDDYPLYSNRGVRQIKKIKGAVGIFVCGSGVGMSIAANRHKKIRAANVESINAAVRSKKEDNANVLVLGSRLMTSRKAAAIMSVWLRTKFSSLHRHSRRLAMLG